MKNSYTFSTERLKANSITHQTAEILVKWRSNPEIIKYFYNNTPVTMLQHLDWYNNNYLNDNTRIDFVLSFNKIPIGCLILSEINVDKKSCEIGYGIAESDFQGKGFATEGVNALVDFGRITFNLNNFIARVHEKNILSHKVCEACGFEVCDKAKSFVKYLKKIN